MKFNYQARTKAGKIQSGVVEASSKEAAFDALKKRELFVTVLEESFIPIYARKLKLFERVSRKDIMVFSQHLSIMFKSRVPLVEIFQTLAQQTKKAALREVILGISEEVEGGTSLSDAFANYPKLFSPFYISMVKSGEASGKLTDVFLYLADYLEREHHFRSKITGALVYPAFILVVFSIVISIIVTFVIPQLTDFLKETEQELPWITKLVIALSDFLKTKGWILIVGIVVLTVVIYRFARTAQGKGFFNLGILKVPFFSPFFKKLYLARFALNLSTLISGGLPIIQALEITGEVVGNDVYKEVIWDTRDEVRRGEKMSTVLRKYPHLISPIFLQMVVVGEKTGTLDTTLKNVVDFYQEDIDKASDNFVKLIEPVLIIFLGIIVGGLVISVLMPIYSFGGM